MKIEEVDEINFLGVTIDSKLPWELGCPCNLSCEKTQSK